MSANNNKSNRLHSWKEIASYLECDKRTCRRWESELELPIHRISDSPKARVFAYKEEIDEWLKVKNGIKRSSAKPNTKKFGIKTVFILIILFIVTIPLFINHKSKESGQAGSFSISGSVLSILDSKGKEISTFDTKIDNLQSQEFYRDHFQYKSKNRNLSTLPYLLIADLNNDNEAEVLFAVITKDEFNSEKLICLNREGKPIWEFSTGRRIKFGDEVFPDSFVIKGFNKFDFNNDGHFEIVIFSNAKGRFPTQLCVLSHEGEKIGEYWNSGQINDIEAIDLNNDHNKELVVVGRNNEYGTGCVMVFNPNEIHGSSPQSKSKYISHEIGKGSEKHYILIPRTNYDKLIFPIVGLIRIEDFGDNLFQVITSKTMVLYQFNYSLERVKVILGHTFQEMYSEMVLKGELEGVDFGEYEKTLGRGIKYWNGREWDSKPVISRVR